MTTNPASFCENCGAPLTPEMRFCEGCGHAVAPATAAPGRGTGVGVPPGPGPVVSPPAQPVAAIPGRGGPRVGLIVGVVLLVGLIGAGTGYYFWKSPPRGAGTPPPSATGTVTPTPPAPPPALDQTAPAVPYVPPPAPVVVQPPVEPPPAPIAPPAAMPDMAPGGPRWPWTAERLITNSDLRFLEARDLELMRNEIYARHGWVFKRQDLQQYFQSQPWYRPKGSAANREEANRLAAAELNPVEKRNVQIIQYHEKGGR